MKKIFKDNRGVSLVELLIVMAIMVVITGGVSLGIGLASSKNATQCAKNMQIAMDKNRTTIMGKKNGRISFFTDTNGSVYMMEEFDYTSTTPDLKIEKATKIGKSDVTVKYGSAGTELDSTGFTISFSRSGSLASGEDCFPIVVSKNKRTYTIQVEKTTGKISMTQN